MATSADLRRILKRFPNQQILVLGDVMLDRYWGGETARLSPEAPVPVVQKQRATLNPGGAANTAANLAALGAAVKLFGVTGTDPESAELKSSLAQYGVASDFLLTDASRPTTTKTRIVAMHQQVVRVDEESTAPIPEALAAQAARMVAEHLGEASAVVISDYAKGFVTPSLLASVIGAARQARKPVFVDPKGPDHARYAGCFLLKPNRLELSILTGLPVRNREEVVAAGCRLSAIMPGTQILVTQGREGMTLFSDSEVRETLTPVPRQVYDVTGAGDTVLATMALAIAAGASMRQAIELALEAAAIAVGLMGTAAVTVQQLEAAIST
jgi:rfaE bifunctional protein kinase chain/domain